VTRILTTLLSVVVAVGATIALFVALNWVLDQAPRRWRVFTTVVGALLGAVVGAFANSGGWFLGGPAWPLGGAALGAGLGALVWGRKPPPRAKARRIPDRLRPWVFLFPAFFFLLVGLFVPTIRTIYLSFRSRRGEEFAGIANYRSIFRDKEMISFDGFFDIFTSRLFLLAVIVALAGIGWAVLHGRRTGAGTDLSAPTPVLSLSATAGLVVLAMVSVLRGVLWNNLFWVVIVTAVATAAGLGIAVLADRTRGESAAKSLIFMPLAISFVGASVIWRFVYAYTPAGSQQIGLLNAVWVGAGGEPQNWLFQQPWNTLFLIAIMIWVQTGFAMVVLSAAIKAVPIELTEAARMDGATEPQIFWRITVPQIRSTIVVVVTTLVITVLKVYDIVKVMTNGTAGTNVIANQMFDEAFINRNVGRGAALAVLLFIAVIPVMVINVRRSDEGATA